MQTRFIASDGTPLRYGATGPEDGPVVVLCHGLGAAGRQFRDDAEHFAARGFRVLLPDLRGHGASGRPEPVTAAACAPERLEQDLAEMLDHAGAGRVHWVGNSLGGIIGLGLVAARPGRFASLALFGTALALNLPARTGVMLPLLDRVPGRALAAAITARSTTRNRAARPLIAAMLARYDAATAAGIVAHICRYDRTAAATGWTGPGLVLVGGADRAVNLALRRQLPALAGRSNWRIVELPEGGHCANLDATQAWRQALLAFWAESGPG